ESSSAFRHSEDDGSVSIATYAATLAGTNEAPAETVCEVPPHPAAATASARSTRRRAGRRTLRLSAGAPGNSIPGRAPDPSIRRRAATEDRNALDRLSRWRRDVYDRSPEREGELRSTISGVDVDPLYTPDNAPLDYQRDLGYPGEFPFT